MTSPIEDFDSPRFQELLARLRRGELAAELIPESALAPPAPEDLMPPPEPGTALYAECLALGEEALRAGAVACVIVAGGAGTRLGGAIKALIPVLGSHTFLDLKLEEARSLAKRYGAPLPVALMTSPLTHAGIEEHVDARGRDPDILLFQQRMLPRLTPALERFVGADGQPSHAPSGHGDFFRALVESGTGQALRARGVRHLLFANLDNLAATPEPLLIGLHRKLGRDLSVEVTPRAAPDGTLDTGAAPVRIQGRPQLVEQVDSTRHPLLSTNNLTFELEPLLSRDLPLPYRVVRKEVAGQTILQLEQVTGEVTRLTGADGRALLSTAFIEVPRGPPPHGRFEPVKSAPELERLRQRLQAPARH